MTTHAFLQEHHSTTSTTSTRAVPAGVRTRPISPQARVFVTRNGDPADGDAEKLRIYIELRGEA